MGRTQMSKSEKIRAYQKANPKAKPVEIAKALGVNLALVYVVRKNDKKKANAAPKANIVRAVKAPATPKPDLVNHPPHYTMGGIETIDFIAAKLTKDEFVGYLKGNVLKYGSRIGKKDAPNVDAGKLAWYAARLRDTVAA